MKRFLIFLYGIVCYSIFAATLLYLIGFVENIFVVNSLDAEAVGPLGKALFINISLLLLFALQHTIMARPTFKKYWTKIIHPATERATYVLFTCICLGILFWQWRPMGGIIWDVQTPAARIAIYVICAFGWTLMAGSTFLINHFELFGLTQGWAHFRGKEPKKMKFVTPVTYKLVRHPLYVGWQIAFWATPTMTAAHLVFAAAMTVYILIAIKYEERNLLEYHGQDYTDYKKRVPMLIPFLCTKKDTKAVVNPA